MSRAVLGGLLALCVVWPACAQCTMSWSARQESMYLPYGTRKVTVFDIDGPGPLGVVPIAINSDGQSTTPRLHRWNGAAWLGVSTSALGSAPTLNDLLVFDEDGPGPRTPTLYVAGNFLGPGSTRGVVRFDGTQWLAAGNGLAGVASSLTTHDPDGEGPMAPLVVAAGTFPIVSGSQRGGIAAWNGESWSGFGTGVRLLSGNGVGPVTSWDPDGAGPQPPMLVVGGAFTEIDGVPAANLAAWTGEWRAFDAGGLRSMRSVAQVDPDGAGPLPAELYASGTLVNPAGGSDISGVARWDGTAWTYAGGAFNTTSTINLTVHDLDLDGPLPPRLFATGAFTTIDGQPFARAAVLGDAGWEPIPGTPNAALSPLWSIDTDGDGPKPPRLLAYAQNLTMLDDIPVVWDTIRLRDGRWTVMYEGFDRAPSAFFTFDPDGPGPQIPVLLAGGSFSVAPGGVRARRLAQWDGQAWSPFGGDITATNSYDGVYAFAMHDPDGIGPLGEQLHIAGAFTAAGGVPVSNIARWDGTTWQPLGLGLNAYVSAIASYDRDGTGPIQPALYATGDFTTAGGNAALRFARWTNTSWLTNLGGLDEYGTCLHVFDRDGSGPIAPLLLVGGGFFWVNGGTLQSWGATAWNGTAYQAISTLAEDVTGFVTFDPDGPGTTYGNEVFVAVTQNPYIGRSAGGTTFQPAAGWGGTAVSGIAVFDDDGPGPARDSLVISGQGFSGPGLFKWTITQWVSMNAAVQGRIFVHDDDGPGPLSPALYAASGPQTPDGYYTQIPGRLGQALPPRIDRHPASKAAAERGVLRLQAFATGEGAITYRWQRNGADLAPDVRVSGAATPTLVISPVRRADAGEYRAVITYPCGQVMTRPAVVTVTPACNPDFDGDGMADQMDVAYLANVIAGGANPTGRDPDFNMDGNVDQDDYAALIQVVAGGDCP
jgi:hypothetical protein